MIRCASVDSIDFVRAENKFGTLILTNLRTGSNQIPGGGVTSGDVGSVRVHGWNLASIAGSVTGDIVLSPRTASNMDTEGTITQLSNTTIAGSLLGNVNCDRGSISNLFVTGTIGTRANPVTISADGTRAVITAIRCAEFYGTLRGRSDLASAPAPREFRTTGGPIVGTLRVAGLGNPTLTSVNDGLSCAGDLEAQVNINGVASRPITVTGTILADKYIRIITIGAAGNANPNISINRLASGATLRLENGLPSNSTITFGSAGVPGLAGQVLINASNGGGTWAGTVRVGGSSGSVLSPVPNPSSSAQQYTSTDIGGGAVGRAPFTVWKRDCSPPTVGSQPGAQSLAAFGQGSVPVDVKFNGPVQFGTGAAQPLFLEYQVPRSTAWNPINAGSMTQSFPGGSTGRTVRLQGVPGIPVNGVGLYRATPTSNLLSNISPTAPVAVTTDAFTFYLGCTIGGNPNPADLLEAVRAHHPTGLWMAMTSSPSSTPSTLPSRWPTSLTAAAIHRATVLLTAATS